MTKEAVEPKKLTIFDIINAINSKSTLEWDDLTEKAYNPFMINRGLSNNNQTVLYANLMNLYPGLTKKQQFDFLSGAIPKGKRFDKWAKKEASDQDVEAISTFYQINKLRAMEAVKILSPEQIKTIHQKLIKGGIKHGHVDK